MYWKVILLSKVQQTCQEELKTWRWSDTQLYHQFKINVEPHELKWGWKNNKSFQDRFYKNFLKYLLSDRLTRKFTNFILSTFSFGMILLTCWDMSEKYASHHWPDSITRIDTFMLTVDPFGHVTVQLLFSIKMSFHKDMIYQL